MRHGVAFRKLSRTSSHRDLLLRNLVTSLIQHEKIKTTLAKAKEASRVAEWVITWGKSGRLEDVRRAESYLMVGGPSSALLPLLLLLLGVLLAKGARVQG